LPTRVGRGGSHFFCVRAECSQPDTSTETRKGPRRSPIWCWVAIPMTLTQPVPASLSLLALSVSTRNPPRARCRRRTDLVLVLVARCARLVVSSRDTSRTLWYGGRSRTSRVPELTKYALRRVKHLQWMYWPSLSVPGTPLEHVAGGGLTLSLFWSPGAPDSDMVLGGNSDDTDAACSCFPLSAVLHAPRSRL
jgi:hypothetical protein